MGILQHYVNVGVGRIHEDFKLVSEVIVTLHIGILKPTFAGKNSQMGHYV